MNNIKYDYCLITLSNPFTDARCQNLAHTFAQFKKNVIVIGLSDNSKQKYFEKDGIKYLLIPIKSSLRLLLKFFKFTFALFKITKLLKAECYIAMDIYTLAIASHLKRKHSAHLVYDSREIYSALGSLVNRKLFQLLLTKYENFYIKFVDCITVSGYLDAQYLRNHFKKDIKIEIILNLPRRKEIVNSNLIREKFDIGQDKTILIYQGMLLAGRGIEKVILSLKHLDSNVLCIFGEGAQKPILEKLIIENDLSSKVFFCGVVPYEELHQWTCSADIGIVFIEPISFSYELALPNKLFEYCMAGKPVLMSNLPAMKNIYDEFKIGELVEPQAEPKELAFAIIKIIENYSFYSSQAILASQKYNYESQIPTIKKIYGI